MTILVSCSSLIGSNFAVVMVRLNLGLERGSICILSCFTLDSVQKPLKQIIPKILLLVINVLEPVVPLLMEFNTFMV